MIKEARNLRNYAIKNPTVYLLYRKFRGFYFKVINLWFSFKYREFRPNMRKILIGGWFGYRFADNSKALFLYLSNNMEKYNLEKVTYVTRDVEIYQQLRLQQYSTVLIGTRESKLEHLTSGIHVIDNHYTDVEPYLSGFAKRIDLWHGFAIKKVGLFDSNHNGPTEIDKAINIVKHSIKPGNWQERYLLSTSLLQEEIHMLSFGCPKEKSIIGCYPRDYYMLNKNIRFYLTGEMQIKKKIRDLKNNGFKIIFYLPTYRDTIDDNNKVVECINKLADNFKKENVYFIIKMHFASKTDEKIDQNEKIIELPPESDLYNFLEDADVLISDYSSIVFDYLFMHRPFIFYCFDMDTYERDYGFGIDYDRLTKNIRVYEISDLTKLLSEILINYHKFLKEYDHRINCLIKAVYDNKMPNDYNMDLLVKNILDL